MFGGNVLYLKIYIDFAKLTAYKTFSDSFFCVTKKSKIYYLSRKADI